MRHMWCVRIGWCLTGHLDKSTKEVYCPRRGSGMQVLCSRCSRLIALPDVIESSGGRLSHLDCARSRGLTPEERALLFVYCSDHVVAHCLSCDLYFRMIELAPDVL